MHIVIDDTPAINDVHATQRYSYRLIGQPLKIDFVNE